PAGDLFRRHHRGAGHSQPALRRGTLGCRARGTGEPESARSVHPGHLRGQQVCGRRSAGRRYDAARGAIRARVAVWTGEGRRCLFFACVLTRQWRPMKLWASHWSRVSILVAVVVAETAITFFQRRRHPVTPQAILLMLALLLL